MALIDETGAKVVTDSCGMMRIDNVPMFRKVIIDGVIHLEFLDRLKARASCRGTRLVAIRLDLLIEIIKKETSDE